MTFLSRFIQVPRGRFARGVALLTGGTALGQLVVIATTPIITRLYSSEELGLASSFLAILLILGVAAALRYDITIPLPEDDLTAGHLLIGALIMSLGVSLTALFIISVLGEKLLQLVNLTELQPYLLLLPIGILAMGVYQTFTYWTIRKQGFRAIARTRITQSLSQIGVQIAAGITGLSAGGLILGYIIGQTNGSGTLAQTLWREHREIFRHISWANIRSALYRYRTYPIFSSLSAIFNSAGLRIAPLLFASLYGLQVAGWYSFADRLTSIPVALMATSIGQAFLAEAAQRRYQQPMSLAPLFYKLALRLLLLGLAIGIPLMVLSPFVLGFVFGEEWTGAVVYVQWWGVILILQMVVSPLSLLNIIEKVHWQFWWDGLRLILSTSVLWFAHQQNSTPETAMMLYALTMVLSYGILFLMNLYALRTLHV